MRLTLRGATTSTLASWSQALQVGGELCRLAPGAKADLLQLDIAQAHLQPLYADPASIAYYARGRCGDQRDQRPGGEAGPPSAGLYEAEVLARARRHLPRWAGMLRQLGGVGHQGLCGCWA